MHGKEKSAGLLAAREPVGRAGCTDKKPTLKAWAIPVFSTTANERPTFPCGTENEMPIIT